MLPQSALADGDRDSASHILWNRFCVKAFEQPVADDVRPEDVRLYVSIVFPNMLSYYTVLGTQMAPPSLNVPSLSRWRRPPWSATA
jgi:hypothetical protein